jgi:ketosteroid isomerase-like protein
MIRGMSHRSRRRLFVGRSHSFAFCALVLFLAGSSRAQRPAVESLRAADRALALRASTGITALATAAAPDIVLLSAGAPIVQGREAVAAVLDSLAGATHDRLAWTALRIDASADEDRGYTYGRGTRTTTVSGRDGTSAIRYAAWWRRDGGTWRVAALLLIDQHAGADTTSPWSCTSVTPPVARTSRDAAREVIGADSAFAARSLVAGPATAFAEYVADDGVSLGGGSAPACGKHDVAAQLEGAAPRDLTWSPIVGDAAASGDLGYTAGTATVQGAHGIRYTKYLTIWKRQIDGTWRFVADGGNAAPARQRALAAP